MGCDIYHAELIQQKHNNNPKQSHGVDLCSQLLAGQMCGSLQDAP